MRRVAYYEHHTGKLNKPLTLAVVSDLHNEEYEDIFPLIEQADALLVPGDISDRYHQQYERGIAFLTDAAKPCPYGRGRICFIKVIDGSADSEVLPWFRQWLLHRLPAYRQRFRNPS